jgi:hypothetical protein
MTQRIFRWRHVSMSIGRLVRRHGTHLRTAVARVRWIIAIDVYVLSSAPWPWPPRLGAGCTWEN